MSPEPGLLGDIGSRAPQPPAEPTICSESSGEKRTFQGVQAESLAFRMQFSAQKNSAPPPDLMGRSCICQASSSTAAGGDEGGSLPGSRIPLSEKKMPLCQQQERGAVGVKRYRLHLRRDTGRDSSPPSWYLQAIFGTILAAMENE